MRKLITLGVAALLSGCISFVPTYQDDIFKKLDAVQTDIAKLVVAGQIAGGSLSSDKADPIYTDALANLKLALDVAQGRASYLRGKIAAKPAQDLANNIGLCQSRLGALQQLNQRGPVKVEAIVDSGLDRLCAIPKIMEGSLKPK